MKIAIVGTGAMGSVYAALLGKAGHEVWAIDTWQEHIDAIAKDGLALSGAERRPSSSHDLHVGRTPGDAGPCDVWVIATKAADVEAVARASSPCWSRTASWWRSRTASAPANGSRAMFPRRTC